MIDIYSFIALMGLVTVLSFVVRYDRKIHAKGELPVDIRRKFK